MNNVAIFMRTRARTLLALLAATAIGATALPAEAQTTAITQQPGATTSNDATGALGDVGEVLLLADDLDDVTVYGMNGEEIGDIEEIVVDNAGTHYIVLSVGGFLGIGDDDVAIPLENFAARGDESLVLVNMTADQLEEMAEYESGMEGYTIVTGSEPMRFRSID